MQNAAVAALGVLVRAVDSCSRWEVTRAQTSHPEVLQGM